MSLCQLPGERLDRLYNLFPPYDEDERAASFNFYTLFLVHVTVMEIPLPPFHARLQGYRAHDKPIYIDRYKLNILNVVFIIP